MRFALRIELKEGKSQVKLTCSCKLVSIMVESCFFVLAFAASEQVSLVEWH